MPSIAKYTQEEFQQMHKACKLSSEILDKIGQYVKPGVTTLTLDNLCAQWIKEANAIPACLGYKGYPKTICTSVNSVICHGIPNEKEILQNGDILNIDVTVILDGWYGDSSRMYYVGKPAKHAKLLCERTYECLMRGIEQVRPGNTFGCIGNAIQVCAENYGYSVVREYCGHGVGRQFHMEPHVMHYGQKNTGPVLEAGMIFTIEPMINLGSPETEQLKDGWTVLTKDRKLSAQWEHCIGVTTDGYIIFTLSQA